jgi:pimeloyl-ACP methyl ester carboxylesterase
LTRRRLFWIFGPLLVLALLAVAGFRTRPVEFFNAYTESRMLLSGAETHTAAVAGHRVHYYAMGPASGPPVVLVHGLGGRSEDWRNLAPYLVRAGYRVYLPDLVGYGQSEQPSGFSYSVDDEAGVVVGLFDVLGLKQVDLGGWSMGGWIVQRVAAEQPDRVRKLMLFDSAGLLVKPDWDTGLFTPRNASELAELDALLMPHPPVVPDFVARDILRLSNHNAWVIHRALATMLTGRDATDSLLAQLRMPVLIVWGQVDRITPLSEGETMHKLIPQSQLDLIPDCGHLAPSMCARQIGPGLVAFLH